MRKNTEKMLSFLILAASCFLMLPNTSFASTKIYVKDTNSPNKIIVIKNPSKKASKCKKRLYTLISTNESPHYSVDFNNNRIFADKSKKKHFHMHKQFALKGNSTSQAFIAQCYKTGKLTKKNKKLSRFWYKQSAIQNNPIAEYHLAKCYEYGIGGPKNYAKARYWYKKSAKNGNANAQYNLAMLYKKGKGGRKNPKKARFWFRKADKSNATSFSQKVAYKYIVFY